MPSTPDRPLRILTANASPDVLRKLDQHVLQLGHEVVARETDVARIGAVTAELLPDVAIVEVGASPSHALVLIEQIVREAECPVIVLLDNADPEFVREAARRGVFAYIVNFSEDELQSWIEITLERFTEYQRLQGAFGRRAVIEQAKGILMARRLVTAEEAFTLLREQSQRSGRKIADLSAALVDAHVLLAEKADPGQETGPALNV